MFTKLNLGCGQRLQLGDDWLNMDLIEPHGGVLQKHPEANFRRGTLTDIPVEDGTIEMVHLRQVFEHLTPYDADEALREFWRVLRPGGILYMDMPNLLTAAATLQRAIEVQSVQLYFLALRSFYGSFEQPGQKHQWGYCPEVLIPLLNAMGWKNVHMRAQHEEAADLKALLVQIEGLTVEEASVMSDNRTFAVACLRGEGDMLGMPEIALTGGVKQGLVSYPVYVK